MREESETVLTFLLLLLPCLTRRTLGEQWGRWNKGRCDAAAVLIRTRDGDVRCE